MTIIEYSEIEILQYDCVMFIGGGRRMLALDVREDSVLCQWWREDGSLASDTFPKKALYVFGRKAETKTS